MKWLILQSNGEHQGQDSWTANHFLRECFAWQDALLRCGHTADICGPRHPGFNSALPKDRFAALCDCYDVVLVAEQYETAWLPDLAQVERAFKIHWIVDLHILGPVPYAPISRACDLVLHATRSLMDGYQMFYASQAKHLWFPNSADDRYFLAERYLDVARGTNFQFIGGRGTEVREKTLRTLETRTDLLYRYGVTGYDYIQQLRQTKVGFNVPVGGDINYRTFETIGLGACLLTARDPDLATLGFYDQENCLLYDSADEAVEKYQTAMRTGIWHDIAFAGHRLFARHSTQARVKELLKELPLLLPRR